MGIASLPLEIQLILVPTILFALTFHEYAHARVAYLLGDYTSYYQNRMNLNPFNHLDPFGTFALYFLGFGWAKPVPVVMQNLKNPRSDMMMIAMAPFFCINSISVKSSPFKSFETAPIGKISIGSFELLLTI